MVYGLLNLVGVPVTVNFKTPFASKDVMEYWQRWHLSFGLVLKEMFFNPLRKYLGLGATILSVFLVSAMWHGVTFNFVAWGFFHGIGWMVAYRIARLPWPRVSYFFNIIWLPFVIVFGRILFAESDAVTLMEKIRALYLPGWSNEAYVLNLTLDTKTTVSVIAASVYLVTEVLFFKISHLYKYLRKTNVTILLLVLVAAFGSTGLEGVYGTR
jgi:D-alanyl-lipoteichoic acid acyltransferase DltB (MBOAT superfamily)